jgi:hypothetical protein
MWQILTWEMLLDLEKGEAKEHYRNISNSRE